MSRDEKEEIKGYLVGYGKPPAEHRFQKGVSGNPKGRPKGAKNRATPLKSWNKPTQDMLLDEAYRPVRLREGDAVIELPAIQAVFRAMGVAALKGNRFAQKTIAELVQRVEQQHHDTQYETMETFTEYKMKWNQEIERCKKLGLPDPQPLPHPDDVLIDYRKGTFRIAGPMTKEEKARWDILLQRREEAQAEVLEYARLEEEEPEHAEQYRDWRLFEQRVFDIVNDKMPERYKKKLEGRICAAENEDGEGADESQSKSKAA